MRLLIRILYFKKKKLTKRKGFILIFSVNMLANMVQPLFKLFDCNY